MIRSYGMNRIFNIIGFLLTLVTGYIGNVDAQEIVVRGSTHRYSLSPVSKNANYSYFWSSSGGTSSDFGTDSLSKPILWDGPPGLYTISVFPTDTGTGCVGNSQYIQVRVIDFFIRWQGTSSTICSGSGTEYTEFAMIAEFPQGNKPWSFEYQVDNTPPVKLTINNESFKALNVSSFINNPTKSVSEIHTIRIVGLTAPDGQQFLFDGTEPDASDHIYTVTVNPKPPMVNLGRDTSLCLPERLLLDAGNAGVFYEWSTGSRDQTIWANEGDGLIWVKVFDEHTCSSVDSIVIQLCSPVKSLFVPNVFTPNGDGENDVWRIGGMQDFPGIIVTLFDRWGRLVFKSEPGYPNPWTGERNGKLLPMDAYFYVIDLKDGSTPIRGSVTLIP